MNRLLAVLLLCSCGFGCAGTGLFGGEQRTLVRLYDADTGVRLELANETHPELRDVYSRPSTEASLKLAPDDVVEALVEQLEELEFDALSRPGGPPQAGELFGWVEVTDGGETRTFAVPRAGPTIEQLSSFARMQLVISDVFSHLGGLQFIENTRGSDYFRTQPGAGGRP